MKVLRAVFSAIAVMIMAFGILVAVPQTARANVIKPVTVSVVTTAYQHAMFSHSYPVHVAAPTTETNPVRSFEVRKGNTLTGIAHSQKVAWQSLYCENKQKIGVDPNFIKPGERLIIPEVKVICKIEDGTKTTITTTAAYTSTTQQSGNGSNGGQTQSPPPPPPPVQSLTQIQQIAWDLLSAANRAGEFSCLNSVIMVESSWNVYAQNPGSGAYGIPQALPGSKMSIAGPDWESSAYTQLRWMIDFYIPSTYGDACNAWAHEQSDGWY
jgi:hypothetical protein